jgi:pyruvate dehydrogenase E1 component beta subunit
MRTAFVSGDPVLFCEAVALYNRRDWDGFNLLMKYPPLEQLIQFGNAEVYNQEAEDLAIITYGITFPMCMKVAEQLKDKNINTRVIDLRTVKPIDWDTVNQAVKDCSRVLIVSEDRFYGGVGPTIAGYITNHLFDFLDAPVKIITSQDCRVAYGSDGDEICLPRADQIYQNALEIAEY